MLQGGRYIWRDRTHFRFEESEVPVEKPKA